MPYGRGGGPFASMTPLRRACHFPSLLGTRLPSERQFPDAKFWAHKSCEEAAGGRAGRREIFGGHSGVPRPPLQRRNPYAPYAWASDPRSLPAYCPSASTASSSRSTAATSSSPGASRQALMRRLQHVHETAQLKATFDAVGASRAVELTGGQRTALLLTLEGWSLDLDGYEPHPRRTRGVPQRAHRRPARRQVATIMHRVKPRGVGETLARCCQPLFAEAALRHRVGPARAYQR